MLLAIVYAANFIPQNPDGDFWNAQSPWFRYLLRWDAGWYSRIAREGYFYEGNNLIQNDVVFYPLYPLLTRVVSLLSGLPAHVSLLLISNAAILAAIVLIYHLVLKDYDRTTAFYSVLFLSLFPTSLFFSSGYTESLALLLIVLFFCMLTSKRFLLASVFAGLALATRSTSIVLLLPLTWGVYQSRSAGGKNWLLRLSMYLLIATSGLWLFMIYLWRDFNSPLAFAAAQQAWHGGDMRTSLLRAVTLRSFHHLTNVFHSPVNARTIVLSLDPWFFLLFVLLLVVFRKTLTMPYFLFTLGALAVPYLSFSGSTSGFASFTRYLLLAFPIFIIVAQFCKQRRWLAWSLAGLSAVLLFIYTALFAQWYWAG